MPTFRVRTGEVLAHDGKVREAGEIIELPRAVADDPAVRGAIEEVDAAGNPVTAPPADDLARFRTHERVTMLRDRLAEAQARVTAIQAQLAAEEQRLIDEVRAVAEPAAAVTSAASPTPKTPDPAGDKAGKTGKQQES